MGKKLYEKTEAGGIRFSSGRKPGEVRVPNYVYDLWLPLLGAVAIGVYNLYCRLERENIVKAISLKNIANACRIGTDRLDKINEALKKCGFIEIAKPTGWKRLAHYTTEFKVLDPPREVPTWAIEKYAAERGYDPLTPWLVAEEIKTPMGGPENLNGFSGKPKQGLDKDPNGTPNVVTLGLQPLGVELMDVETNFFIKNPNPPVAPSPDPGGGADSGKEQGSDDDSGHSRHSGGTDRDNSVDNPDCHSVEGHQFGIGDDSGKETDDENIIGPDAGADPLLMPLARATAAARAEAGDWTNPSNDGADVAEAALSRFCAMQGELPTDGEREGMLRELAETLKPLKPTVEEIDGAFDIMAEDFGYRVGNYNVYQDSFKRDLATCIRRARGRKQRQPDRRARYARTAEIAAESQAALRERMASRGPPAEDDAIGDAVKDELRLQMTKATFDTWVKPAGMVCEDGVFVVTAANAFAKDWLEDRLATTIKRTAVGVLGPAVEVRFETQEGS